MLMIAMQLQVSLLCSWLVARGRAVGAQGFVGGKSTLTRNRSSDEIAKDAEVDADVC